jgi:hypothetical protein
MIEISKVRLDGGTQSRAAIHEDTVAEYAAAMADPATVFPPIIVYFDGSDHWLADGFHRLEAWRRIGRVEVPVEIRQGDRRKAILHSVAANSAHGLRRTNDDKRRAVLCLLEDAEWSQWHDTKIAEQCRVSPDMVAAVRTGLTIGRPEVTVREADAIRREQKLATEQGSHLGTSPSENAPADGQFRTSPSENAPVLRKYVNKHGQEAVMNVAKIGKAKPAEAEDLELQKLARMTPDAMMDEVLGLRADLADERARRKAVEAERDNLKGIIKAFESEDMGRSLGNALREINTIKGRMAEYQAKAARAERYAKHLEAERDDLKRRLEAQEIAL